MASLLIVSDDTKDWEIESSSIKIGEFIGRGAFADVHKGTLYQDVIAIKKLHEYTNEEERKKAKLLLQNEIKTLRKCRHKNVVELKYVCLDPPMLILSFAEKGNLRDF